MIDARGQMCLGRSFVGLGLRLQQFPRYSTFKEAPFCSSIQADLQKAGFPAPSQIQQPLA